MLPVIRKRNYGPDYFDRLFDSNLLSSFFSDGADYTVPLVNIKELEKGFEIEMAVPGLSKNDFSITVENDVLTIASEKKSQNEVKEEDYMQKEFQYNSFSRSFTLPDSVDTEKIKASHKNGVLTVELPRNEEAKVNESKKIKIS